MPTCRRPEWIREPAAASSRVCEFRFASGSKAAFPVSGPRDGGAIESEYKVREAVAVLVPTRAGSDQRQPWVHTSLRLRAVWQERAHASHGHEDGHLSGASRELHTAAIAILSP